MTPIFDAHLDLAWNALQWDRDLTLPLEVLRQAESPLSDHRARGRAMLSLPELRRGGVAVCLATVLVRSRPNVAPAAPTRRDLDHRNQTHASAVGLGQLAYYQLLERQGHIRLIRTRRELDQHWMNWSTAPQQEPLGVIVAMEGADPITGPEQVPQWREQGLRCVGLAHYGASVYACGTGAQGSITERGRALIVALRDNGMILDLTHCAEPGFFEALDLFDGPVHASHNMCRALVPGDRQFSDEQLRRLIERGAVIGMALDAWMLKPGWVVGQTSRQEVSLAAVADHVDHICQLAGSVRHVGIGSDLDGGFGSEQCPRELESIADLQQLGSVLCSRGYGDDDVKSIFHGNWLRFFSAALPA